MLAKPTRPTPPTVIDLRFRQADRKRDELFDGWGVHLGPNA
jgi:hypothetical protein